MVGVCVCVCAHVCACMCGYTLLCISVSLNKRPLICYSAFRPVSLYTLFTHASNNLTINVTSVQCMLDVEDISLLTSSLQCHNHSPPFSHVWLPTVGLFFDSAELFCAFVTCKTQTSSVIGAQYYTCMI